MGCGRGGMARHTRFRRQHNRAEFSQEGGEARAPVRAAVLCFQCRQPGHAVRDCPAAASASRCYACGAADHTSRACTVAGDGRLRFAVCFVCRETGHVAGQCEKNAHGMYPEGGCCRRCGSVRHLARDCRLRRGDGTGAAARAGAGLVGDVRGEGPEDDALFASLAAQARDARAAERVRRVPRGPRIVKFEG
jgi:zinc finger CCHC domain-containing protein 9